MQLRPVVRQQRTTKDLIRLAFYQTNATSLHAIYQFGTAAKAPLDGEIAMTDLANGR